jgi:hypothetical protein
MYKAVCPACGEDIEFEDSFQVGQSTVCPKCLELLAVVMTEPLIFDFYSFASTAPQWFDAEKQEAAKKHERKHKHRRDDVDELEDDLLRRKSSKKIRNKTRLDW